MFFPFAKMGSNTGLGTYKMLWERILLEDYPIEYYEFFVSFNEGDYYTCHDLLEEMWMTDKGNLFFKGLLQMSVSIYHYEYGNVKGARLMMQAARDYLQSYRPKIGGSTWSMSTGLLKNVSLFFRKKLIGYLLKRLEIFQICLSSYCIWRIRQK
jgi:predicted metal-dependent hydrolase